VRRINIGKASAQSRQRFWGPCSPNPWSNSLFVGPPARRPIDGTTPSEERRQHRAAINAWEDEGGSVAASTNPRSLRASDRDKAREAGREANRAGD
jgi:hypothetical protein